MLNSLINTAPPRGVDMKGVFGDCGLSSSGEMMEGKFGLHALTDVSDDRSPGVNGP